MGLYASKNYLKKFGTPKKIEDLESHQMISSSSRSKEALELFNWHLKLGKDLLQKSFKPYLTSNHCFAVAKNDLGIAFLAKENRLLKEKKELIEVLPEIKKPQGNVFFVYSEHLRKNRPIKLFADFVMQAIKKEVS